MSRIIQSAANQFVTITLLERMQPRVVNQGMRVKRFFSDDPTRIDPPPINEPPIPRYQGPKYQESLSVKKARLMYQSRKRGMLENDLLLATFAKKFLPTMTETQLLEYDELINGVSNDWDIYNWVVGLKPTPVEMESSIMKLLKEHAKNLNKESRIRQPDL